MKINELQALASALEIEKAELRFYIQMATKAKNEKAKNMFLFLAREEAEHWDLFESNLIRKIAETGKIPVAIREIVEELTPEYEGTLSEIKAVELGMQQEKVTWEFYEKAAEEAEDKKVRELFRRLAKIEEAHYELLKAQYDSVMKTGIWMDYQDFSLEVD